MVLSSSLRTLSSCYSWTTSSISSDSLPAVLAIISCGFDPLIVMLNFFYTALVLKSKSFIFTLSPGQAMYELTRPPGLLASHVFDMLSPRHWATGGWNNWHSLSFCLPRNPAFGLSVLQPKFLSWFSMGHNVATHHYLIRSKALARRFWKLPGLPVALL